MLKRLLPIVSIIALLSFATSAWAQPEPTLKVGDKAPPLSDGRWVKGEPVKEFESGKVYIVEFWATWCGPCVAVIPHVTELQHKYADRGLIVIGQNVWEDDEADVEPFVERMGDKMDYRVVLDDPSGDEGHMATRWMQAAGRNGIPCSFIIDQQGKIAWIGHPAMMGPVVEKVIAGNFDPAAEAEKDRKVESIGQRLNAAARSGDIDAAVAAAEEIREVRPELAPRVAMVKFRLLAGASRWDEAYAEADKAIDQIDDAQALNELAWMIVAPDSPLARKDLDVAMKAADKSNQLAKEKDAAILDTVARVRTSSNTAGTRTHYGQRRSACTSSGRSGFGRVMSRRRTGSLQRPKAGRCARTAW